MPNLTRKLLKPLRNIGKRIALRFKVIAEIRKAEQEHGISSYSLKPRRLNPISLKYLSERLEHLRMATSARDSANTAFAKASQIIGKQGLRDHFAHASVGERYGVHRLVLESIVRHAIKNGKPFRLCPNGDLFIDFLHNESGNDDARWARVEAKKKGYTIEVAIQPKPEVTLSGGQFRINSPNPARTTLNAGHDLIGLAHQFVESTESYRERIRKYEAGYCSPKKTR